MRPILALITILLIAPHALASEPINGTASVIDGDTIEIHGQRIRLHGIDAPESGQICIRKDDGARTLCGREAGMMLAERIGEFPVSCEQTDKDRYGRIVAICVDSDGKNLNAWMVSRGQALAYRSYSEDYVIFEDAARAGGLGIWSTNFVLPWVWRKKPREPNESDLLATAPVPSTSFFGGPNCKAGKPCGGSCISMDKVCRK